jgi:uncharacterized protein involved in exopolysaccharide biosynthesis
MQGRSLPRQYSGETLGGANSDDSEVRTEMPPISQMRDETISLLEIANIVLRHWRTIISVPVVLALAVGVWTLTQDREYVVSASFLPQAAESRGLGGAAALAQQFGMSLAGDRSGQSPQFYVDLLRSRSVLREVVESEYQVPQTDGTVSRATLIDFYEVGRASNIPAWRRATKRLSANLSTSVSRETGVVQLTVSATDPVLAEQVSERLLEILNRYNMEVRQARAQEEGRFISARLMDAHAGLLSAETALQAFLRQNREFRNSPELTFEHDRLQRQVAMRQEVYTSLLRSKEQASIDAVRDTPLLSVIDHPAGTAEPQGRGTGLRVILAFLLGLMLAALIAFGRELTRRGSEARDPEYQEFQGLARNVWEDLRHPRRWLSRRQRPVPAGDR